MNELLLEQLDPQLHMLDIGSLIEDEIQRRRDVTTGPDGILGGALAPPAASSTRPRRRLGGRRYRMRLDQSALDEGRL